MALLGVAGTSEGGEGEQQNQRRAARLQNGIPHTTYHPLSSQLPLTWMVISGCSTGSSMLPLPSPCKHVGTAGGRAAGVSDG